MPYETIVYDIDADGILTITLNRPDKLNAFNNIMGTEMIAALTAADTDDAVRAIIVTGAGRGFCAGADLSSGSRTFDSQHRQDGRKDDRKDDREPGPDAVNRDGGGKLSLRIYDSHKPIIAAVNGPAVGVGATMQLPMDVRIASADARFGFVFARRGIVPEACSSWFLPRLVGISQALDWAYSGRVFDADEALRGGLIREVLAPDQLLPRARQIARSYMEGSAPVSVTLTRHMFWKMLGADHPMEAHRIDSRGVQARGRSADAREGVSSFLEKRPAEFPNKVSSDLPEFFPWWEPRKFS